MLTLIKNTSIYSIFHVVVKGVNFLLLPVYITHLTEEEFGTVALVMALIAFLGPIFTLSLQGSINRFYHEYQEDRQALERFYSTLLLVVLVVSSVFFCIALLCGRLFSTLLPGVDFFPYILLGLIATWLRSVYLIYQRILQAKMEGEKVAWLDTSMTGLTIAFSLLFVVALDLNASGLIAAQVVAAFILFGFIVIRLFLKYGVAFDRGMVSSALNYSAPLIPHALSGVTSSMIDRIILNRNLGIAEVGVFNLSFQISNLLNTLTQSFNQAYVPWYNSLKKNNETSQIVGVAVLFTVFYCIVALGISIFSRDYLSLFTRGAFFSSYSYIPFLSFSFVFHGIYYFYSAELFYDISGKNNRKLALITIGSAVANIVLNLVLIPRIGLLGAAISALSTKILFAFATSLIANQCQVSKIPFAFLFLITISFFGLSIYFSEEGSFLARTLVFGAIVTIFSFYASRFLKTRIVEMKKDD